MWAVRMNKVGYLAAVCALVATAGLALWLLGSGAVGWLRDPTPAIAPRR